MIATRKGFEPSRTEHNGLAVHHLNHSVTSSYLINDAKVSNLIKLLAKEKYLPFCNFTVG
jgi:hypothetical protein